MLGSRFESLSGRFKVIGITAFRRIQNDRFTEAQNQGMLVHCTGIRGDMLRKGDLKCQARKRLYPIETPVGRRTAMVVIEGPKPNTGDEKAAENPRISRINREGEIP